MTHHENRCKHGVRLGQCRCAAPDKEVRLVMCPASHQDWSESEHPVKYTGTYGMVAVPVAAEHSEWPKSELSYTVVFHDQGTDRKEFSRYLIDQGYIPGVDFIQREGILDNYT